MGKYLIKDKNISLSRTLLFFLALVFVNFFVYHCISRERYIYFWDYYNYWGKYQYLGGLILHSPFKALSALWHSIRYDDYNLFPVLFLMPFRLLFGKGRIPYILAVADTYAIPSAILCTVLVERITSRGDRKRSFIIALLTLSTFVLFPQFWVALLVGYPGAAGVAVIFIIFMLVFRAPVEEMSARTLVLLGLLLALLVLLRRWYAYWVVAFFVALTAERLVSLFPRFHLSAGKYLLPARNIIVVGAVSVSVFFLVATPVSMRMLTTDYSDIYSAYRLTSGIGQFLKEVFGYLGPFISGLFALSLTVGIAQKRTRRLTVFLIFHFFCVVILFSRVQDFGLQHFYLIIPTIILSTSLLAVAIWRILPNVTSRSVFLAFYTALLALQFMVMYVPKAAGYFEPATHLFSPYRYHPLVRNDLSQIKALLDSLERLSHGGKGGIYVDASSGEFNDDMLRKGCRAFDYPEHFCHSILLSSDVDKRDGFPMDFLHAGYVVVANPIQYCLRPEDQRVVGVLSSKVTSTRGIGASFEKMPSEFLLDNNVKINIYKKIRPFRDIDLLNLQNLFLSYYPDRKAIFTIPIPGH